MHTYMAHIPTISGIDMALWDLAGKIIGLPVCALLGGPFRDAIPMYSHGVGLDMLDKGSCRDWAQRIKAMPEGFTAFKNDIDPALGVPIGPLSRTRSTARRLRNVRAAYNNCAKPWEKRSTSRSTAITNWIRPARSGSPRPWSR